jgi:ubiquitin C-terminal hydrolase
MSNSDDSNITDAESEDEYVIGVNGFENLGNTCYLNSIFQVLTRTKTLKDMYITRNYRQYLKTEQSELSEIMEQLMNIQHTHGGVQISPRRIVKWFYRNFRNAYQQQDCHEIILKMLHHLESELVPGYKSVFQGTYTSKLICRTCDRESTVTEVNSTLILSVPNDVQRIHLHECINAFFGDEQVACCSKRYQLVESPRVLMVLLKRFIIMREEIVKISTYVEYPTELRVNDTVYRLYAVISHHGKQMYRGHYTATCAHEDKIYKFDDENWTEMEDFACKDAYILFYHQEE